MARLRKSLVGLLAAVGSILTLYTVVDRSFLHPQPTKSPGELTTPTESTTSQSANNVWSQLATEVGSGVSATFGHPGLQLLLAFLAGVVAGGVGINRLHPLLERLGQARRVRAAERRQRLRLDDERLLAEAAAARGGRKEASV